MRCWLGIRWAQLIKILRNTCRAFHARDYKKHLGYFASYYGDNFWLRQYISRGAGVPTRARVERKAVQYHYRPDGHITFRPRTHDDSVNAHEVHRCTQPAWSVRIVVKN